MSRQIRVNDQIEFVGSANQGYSMGHQGNVQGRMNQALVTFYDDFFEDTLGTGLWNTSVANGGAVAISVMANGAMRLTANAGVDDNCAEVATEANWYAAQSCALEMRVKVDNITTVGICIGFVNAVINTNDQIKCEVTGTTVVDRGTTPDIAAFVFDTDATTDRWYVVNSLAGTEGGTLQAAGIVPVNATYEVFRIELDSDGNAYYYRNGASLGIATSAVTATTALRAYAGLITRVDGARNLDVDYIKIWQNRLEGSTVLW